MAYSTFLDYQRGMTALGRVAQARMDLTPIHRLDADSDSDATEDKKIKPFIPGRKSRGKAIKCDKRRDKQCKRIESMFGRLKNWRRNLHIRVCAVT